MTAHQSFDNLEEDLRSVLPPEQHIHIPTLLSLLARAEHGALPAEATRRVLDTSPQMRSAIKSLAGHAQTRGLFALGANSQAGDITTGDVAGRDVITVNVTLPPVPSGEPSEAAERFADGLSALSDLVSQWPEARAVVQLYYGKLAAARAQVRELINLKVLHDLLHGVQYQDLPLLISESQRFPDDDTAIMGIEHSEINLRSVVDQIEQLVSSGEVPSAEAS